MAQRQVDLVNQQIEQTNVYADISGVADQVNIRLGEFFNGNNQIRIVNTNDLKAVAQVPENYLSRVKVGSNVKVVIPELNNKMIRQKFRLPVNSLIPITAGFILKRNFLMKRIFIPTRLHWSKFRIMRQECHYYTD